MTGSLPKAQAARGDDVDVWMPFHLQAADWYRKRSSWPEAATAPFVISVLGVPYEVGVLRGTLPGSSVPVFFVAHDPLFHRPAIYSPNGLGLDDGLWRFCLFVRAAVEGMKRLGRRPHVINGHDWHAALAPMLGAWSSWRDRWWDDVASVLTIHNISYQGVFGKDQFAVLGLPEESWPSVSLGGDLNLLKGALVASDMITAVSPTYASEIRTREGGAGLDAVLRARADRLAGILNGIDGAEWNPATDRHLAASYSAADLAGKAACRADLCRAALFDPDDPSMVVGAIGRLTPQKGFDLLLVAAEELILAGIRIVMLGSGEPDLERAMRRLDMAVPGRFRAFLGYDEALSHRIEAGADVLAMPSRFEPCGLTQMYSQAYGTPPVVRRTGGLADSIVAFHGGNLDHATGFSFDDPTPQALAATVLWARDVHGSPEAWRRLMLNGMAQDFSWDRSAGQYEAVYRRAREVRGLYW